MSHLLDECCTRCPEDHRYCREIHSECPVCEISEQGCGRLDDHEPHEWHAHYGVPWARYVVRCPGEVEIEGGYFAAEVGAL